MFAHFAFNIAVLVAVQSFKNYSFVFGCAGLHCCAGFSLLVASRGYSLVTGTKVRKSIPLLQAPTLPGKSILEANRQRSLGNAICTFPVPELLGSMVSKRELEQRDSGEVMPQWMQC